MMDAFWIAVSSAGLFLLLCGYIALDKYVPAPCPRCGHQSHTDDCTCGCERP